MESSVPIRVYTTYSCECFRSAPLVFVIQHLFLCGGSALAAIVVVVSSGSLDPTCFLRPSSSWHLAARCTFPLSQPRPYLVCEAFISPNHVPSSPTARREEHIGQQFVRSRGGISSSCTTLLVGRDGLLLLYSMSATAMYLAAYVLYSSSQLTD